MKRFGWVCGAAVLALAVGSGQVFAQAGGGGGGGGGGGRGGQGAGGGRGGFAAGGGAQRGGNPYVNELAQMTTTLKLTDEQKPKIQAKVDAMNAELDTFDQTALTAARGGAGGQGGARGGRGARGGMGGGAAPGDQLRTLVSDYEKLVAKHQAGIDAELTADQKISWETFKLEQALNGRILLMGISGDQTTKLKEMTAAAGKALAELPDLTDVAAIQEVEGKLAKRIMAEVLTEGQASLVMGGAPLPPALQQMAGRGAGGGAGAAGGRAGRGGRGGGAGAAGAAGGAGAIGADGMPAARVDKLP